MATTSTAPKALTFDQLQAYKNANYTEFNNAFNKNNYGFADLDAFVGAQYDNFGRNEIDTGARSNPWATPAAAPASPATVTANNAAAAAAPVTTRPSNTSTAAVAPPASGFSQADIDASIASAIEKFKPAAPPPVETIVAPKADPVLGKVKESETAAGRLEGMLSTNSAYTDRARQIAQEEMAGRGLLSSSMAAGAGVGAAIDAAGQFAITDSGIFANQRLANQDAQNKFITNDLDRTFESSRFNAGAKNEFSALGYKARLDAGLAGLQSSLRSGELKVGADLDMMKLKYGTDLDIVKMNVEQGFNLDKLAQIQANDLTKLGVAQGLDLEKMRVGQGYDLEKLAQINGYDIDKMAKANDYEIQRLILSNDLDTASKEKILGITFKYDELSRSSTTASNFIGAHLTEINRILSDPNIPQDQKQQLIDKGSEALGSSLDMLDKIYKSDFGGIVPVTTAQDALTQPVNPVQANIVNNALATPYTSNDSSDGTGGDGAGDGSSGDGSPGSAGAGDW